MPSEYHKGHIRSSYANTKAPVLKRDIQGQNKSSTGDKGQYGSQKPMQQPKK